ncbi:signal recognition particle, SRP9/SRP14 subunit [Naematelia encephala]|uniref:Signal recognition particle, SRP9/SRP14 subunit n=1 Tax=Naematelia encephala TaxID=71784 RepID=A0A1Y2B1T6_9TREE|nr:signal recognition particle, SRP9/SRP14 subunit [Naematelia encephala]
MVYLKSWTDFETAATDLYAKSPRKVRYCVKFAPKTGHLVLKLTDDTTVIMYKTFSSIVLNRFESLNLRLLSQMANVKPRARISTGLVGAPERSGTPGVDEVGERGSTPAPEGKRATGTATPGGAGKKKKKGKR